MVRSYVCVVCCDGKEICVVCCDGEERCVVCCDGEELRMCSVL